MTEPIKWSNAPDRTSWGASMRVADIALDRDHTLTLFCEADQTAKVDAMFAEVERLRAELARLTKLPSPPPLWGKGCPVCGLGAGGIATGYVCQRGDCPTRVTCGETK